MNPIAFATSLAKLVLWTAGKRSQQDAAAAWKALSDGGKTTTPELPEPGEWLDGLKPSGDQAWSIADLFNPAGPFAWALDELLPEEVAVEIEEAKKAAEELANQVKGRIIGRVVLGTFVGLSVVGAVGYGIYRARRK